jgi:hypothetical protein
MELCLLLVVVYSMLGLDSANALVSSQLMLFATIHVAVYSQRLDQALMVL